jgi:TPP-dependent 2-oxoacid decarboxylase
MYNQTVYGSIGYATGAAVGAFKAIQETGQYKRCILVTGEGSLHMTVQAFADLLKLGLNPIVFVLNNNGYTIERLIYGRDASYNKVPDVGITLCITESAWSTDNILGGLLEACASLGTQVLVQVPRAH